MPLAQKACYSETEVAETVVIPHASRIVEGAPISLATGATLTFLHADASDRHSFNENSLVAMLELGRSRILLMGDAEAGGRKIRISCPRRILWRVNSSIAVHRPCARTSSSQVIMAARLRRELLCSTELAHTCSSYQLAQPNMHR